MTSLLGQGKTTGRVEGLTSCETLSWTFLERRLRLAQSRFLRMKRDGILYRLLPVWSTDTPGRWLEAMSLMPEKIRLRSHAHLAEVAGRISEAGSVKVGAEGRNPCFDLWGRGRGMAGLLRFYDLTGSAEALEATRRMAAPVIETFFKIEDYEYGDECAIGVLEGLVELARATQDNEYLGFARKVAGQVRGLGEKEGYLHLHSYITVLRALLGLFELTGEGKYLGFVMQQHRSIEDALLWPTGGLPEMEPDNGWGETCQTADWLRLNLKLGRITHDKHYFDLAETTLFNHLAFAQRPEGGFVCCEDIYSGTGGPEGWGCCNMSGARAIEDAWNLGNHSRDGVIVLNLYGQSEMQLRSSGKTVASLTQRTRFPDSGDVVILYKGEASHEFPLLARIPAWSPVPEVTINGERLRHPEWENGYVVIEKKWKDGDRVGLRFPMLPRLKPERPKYGATVHDGVSTLWIGPRLFACARAAAAREYQEATVRPDEIRVASRGNAGVQFRRAAEVEVAAKRLTKALVFNAHQVAVRSWLGGRWERFRAQIGLLTCPRYPVGRAFLGETPAGDVIFEVLLDGEVATQERLGVPGTTRAIDVDLRGRSEMVLATTALGSNYHVAESVWANARLISGKKRAYLADFEVHQVPSIGVAGPLASNLVRGSRETHGLLLSAVGADGSKLRLPVVPLGSLTHQPLPKEVTWVGWVQGQETERSWDMARWTLGDDYCIWFSQAPESRCGEG